MTIRLFALAAAFAAMPAVASANADALSFYQIDNAQKTETSSDTKTPAAKTVRVSRVERSLSGFGPAAGDVAALAAQHGVPRDLALSVCQVETRCRYGLVGRAGERGPLQIKLQTARGLGYTGNAAGLNGRAGAYWGVKHLAVAYRKCGSARGAARLHNAGLAASCGGSRYASRVVAGL
jgi:soluble lytic murein transglycosylase-like protein